MIRLIGLKKLGGGSWPSSISAMAGEKKKRAIAGAFRWSVRFILASVDRISCFCEGRAGDGEKPYSQGLPHRSRIAVSPRGLRCLGRGESAGYPSGMSSTTHASSGMPSNAFTFA